ncbi:MAG: hypothetical protein CGU28_02310 [Candidatus Dactylopiibacterium carminicum]|nr:MAG: hypothetical protein CGU28_02310 [Candidatus Dactylopiibacterium carminicum]
MAVAVPILALLLSGFFEGFVWRIWTVLGIASAVLGNLIMLAEPAGLYRWRVWRRSARGVSSSSA